jgi:hypothetical protein
MLEQLQHMKQLNSHKPMLHKLENILPWLCFFHICALTVIAYTPFKAFYNTPATPGRWKESMGQKYLLILCFCNFPDCPTLIQWNCNLLFPDPPFNFYGPGENPISTMEIKPA